jgi:hypothetical protein
LFVVWRGYHENPLLPSLIEIARNLAAPDAGEVDADCASLDTVIGLGTYRQWARGFDIRPRSIPNKGTAR